MKLIPVSKPFKYDGITYNWIDYSNGKVFLIKPDRNGNDANYQVDGTNTKQASVTGFVYKEFESEYKWFNPAHWYKKTNWYDTDDNTAEILFFHSRKYQRLGKSIYNKDGEVNFNEFDVFIESLKPKAIPVQKILQRIIKRASKETGLNIKLDFDDYRYGLHWWEAYIPVKVGIYDKYILTWMNCD